MSEPGFRATFAVAASMAILNGSAAHAAAGQPVPQPPAQPAVPQPASAQPASTQATAMQVSMMHFAPLQSRASDAAAGQPGTVRDGWSGRGEAGLVLSQGNAQSSAASLKVDVANRRERWTHSLQVAALRASSRGNESAAHFIAAAQSDLQVRQHAFWFGGLRYESDRFSGFHYQESASTGAGYRFRDTELLKLSAQVGAGYRRLGDRHSELVYTDTVAVAGFDYNQKLGQNTRLVNRTHAESGRYNTLASNYTGVEVQMNHKLGLSAGYDLRHNSEPPPGLKPDDAVSTVHLAYAF